MKSKMVLRELVAFLVGLIFAIGLAISGMTQPHKVIGFLDPGAWDPSLLFVMLGALLVHAISYPLIRRRRSPILDVTWHVPNRKDITPRLIIGSALFGLGWGMGGYCPGPGLTALSAGDLGSMSFVVAMVTGMLFFKVIEPHLKMRT